MVISPITLEDNYGVFKKDGDMCLLLDMENIHDFTGLAKYDFLILTTAKIIRDTCNYIGEEYPKTCDMNWNDEEVWESMITEPTGIFQMESPFAFQSLQKFEPHSIFDMSLVTAAIRPSGSSYRDELLAHKIHKNPSAIIDEMLPLRVALHDLDWPEKKTAADFHIVQLVLSFGQCLIQQIRKTDIGRIIDPVSALYHLNSLFRGTQFSFIFF